MRDKHWQEYLEMAIGGCAEDIAGAMMVRDAACAAHARIKRLVMEPSDMATTEWLDQYYRMTCGHSSDFQIGDEGGTPYCATCEVERLRSCLNDANCALTEMDGLAELHAERERLQGEVGEAGIRETKWAHDFRRMENRMARFLERAETAEAELARERELIQALRQVVKEYREIHAEVDNCEDIPSCCCDICTRADSLLPDKSKPVVTAEEQ